MYAVLSTPEMCPHIQLQVWQTHVASGQTSQTVVGGEAYLMIDLVMEVHVKKYKFSVRERPSGFCLFEPPSTVVAP